ncbi:MAG: hypothetical protein L0Z50_11165 [Verrucomicrobiales bacterium]|nr:hypothetical protein [Verrucomicrobiales bacterium]
MKLLVRFLAYAIVLNCGISSAAPQLDCYVQLVRGSDSPDPQHATAKEVGPLLGKKLKPVFKWKYYFVNQQEKITLTKDKPSKLRLRNGSDLEIRWIADDKIEVSLRQGKTETSRTQHRNHPELMIIEGVESQNREPWFVVIRRNKPLNAAPDAAPK